MSEKKKSKSKVQDFAPDGVPFEEDLDIFGEHKTREQVKAEEKARKKAEREAMNAEMERRRKAAKDGSTPAKRKDIIAIVAVVVAILLLCVLALGNSLLRGSEERGWEINEDRGYILKQDCAPDPSNEGPTADVFEVYFTKNNHLYVELAIGNGTDKPVRITSLDVAVYDNETGELIAGGKAMIEEEFVVQVADIAYYPFYISPEHIQVDEDAVLPDVCSFDILVDGTPVVIE